MKLVLNLVQFVLLPVNICYRKVTATGTVDCDHFEVVTEQNVKLQVRLSECYYSDTSANEDNSFRNHIR